MNYVAVYLRMYLKIYLNFFIFTNKLTFIDFKLYLFINKYNLLKLHPMKASFLSLYFFLILLVTKVNAQFDTTYVESFENGIAGTGNGWWRAGGPWIADTINGVACVKKLDTNHLFNPGNVFNTCNRGWGDNWRPGSVAGSKWTPQACWAGSGGIEIHNDSLKANTGKSSLRSGRNTNHQMMASPYLNVYPGETYNFCIWARLDGYSRDTSFVILQFDSPVTPRSDSTFSNFEIVDTLVLSPSANNLYKQICYQYTHPALANKGVASIMIRVDVQDSRILFDDFSISGPRIEFENPNCNPYRPQIITDISELEVFNDQLYPNPAIHFVKVEGLKIGDEARIYSSKGKRLKTVIASAHQEQIDITELSSGTFILIINENKMYRFKK